jgi:predicted DNA-binding transcriptional regulator AlpA
MDKLVQMNRAKMWISYRQAAARYGVSTRTLDRWQEKAGFPKPDIVCGRKRLNVGKLDRWDQLNQDFAAHKKELTND